MRCCRLCNRPLNWLQRLAQQPFCCSAHRWEYGRRETDLAVERLRLVEPAGARWCGFLPVSDWIQQLTARTGDPCPARLRPLLWPELLAPDFEAPELPFDFQPESAVPLEGARPAA